MENILEVIDVTKKYENFILNGINFTCQEGSIMGLIGSNGAGKTTLINSILDVIKLDSGNIRIFGKEHTQLTKDDKENLAVVYDENSLPDYLTPKEVGKIFKELYTNWNNKDFIQYLDRLEISQKVAIRDMSKGNKVKINLAVALAHDPRLLILDEITGALDPIMRDEILKLFLEFIQDEKKSILFSSHITSDLEKIADYITFINDGNLIFSKEKDDLIGTYKLVKCRMSKFDELDKHGIVAYHKEMNSVAFLLDSSIGNITNQKEVIEEDPTIEEIMLILAKGVIL
ncbi:MAG: ABC transporter ATP-binding protein [Lachnospiraceae bacterium]|nr:ABC transporter ATP-binding protein [Lachnospiraceae bacterium]